MDLMLNSEIGLTDVPAEVGSAGWVKKTSPLGSAWVWVGSFSGPNGQALTSSREDDMQTGAGQLSQASMIFERSSDSKAKRV